MAKYILGAIILVLFSTHSIATHKSAMQKCISPYCSAESYPIYQKKIRDIKVYKLSDNLIAKQLWSKRVIVIYTSTTDDQDYVKQIDLLAKQQKDLQARDIVIMLQIKGKKPHTPAHKENKNDFRVVLIGKDGTTKEVFTTPVTVNKINNIIDKMPMRKHEISKSTK